MTSALDLMTMAEAAARLDPDLNANILHRARRKGHLRAVKIGKCFYTNASALKEYVEWGQAKKASAALLPKRRTAMDHPRR